MADPREDEHLVEREPAHPADAARWAALTGPLDPAAVEWAERTFGADLEVRRAS